MQRLPLDFGPLPLGTRTESSGGLRLEGAEAERTVLTADGGIGFLLRLDESARRPPHVVDEATTGFLYRLVLDPPPGAIGVPFTLRRAGSAEIRRSEGRWSR